MEKPESSDLIPTFLDAKHLYWWVCRGVVSFKIFEYLNIDSANIYKYYN